MTTRAEAAERSRQLVARHQEGDPHAYAEIYRHYRGDVYDYIYRRVRSRELAQDLTHDTFVRGLKAIGRWKWQGQDLGAWLITIAGRLVIDHFGSRRARSEVKPQELEFGHKPDETREGNVEDFVIEHLRNLALLGSLEILTDDQRACVIHRFIHGLNVAETATLIGKHPNAVKALQWRAMGKLSEHFDERAWR